MKVLIAVDSSEIAEKTFDWYMSNLHKCMENEVIVCHEAEQPDLPNIGMFAGAVAFPQEEIDRVVKEHRHKLNNLAEYYSKKCKELNLKYKVLVDTVEGGVGNAIIKRSENVEAELIVIGTRGQGLMRRTILGSVSDFVLHHSQIPVLVCHV